MIPRCMSTQHPDNVASPFFSDQALIEGEAEVREAYYAFSHLGCEEQMWDSEGKEVDSHVVKKLLTTYEDYFQRNRLGKEVRLTLRVPNPAVETTEGKILLETLESIPRSFDISHAIFQDEISPVFEVILPMASDAKQIERVYQYYKEYVVGVQHKLVADITVKEWVGKFHPEQINVIPLFEDKYQMMHAGSIVKEYLADKDMDYQRVFLARSDPALNYGSLAAVIYNKIALQQLHLLAQERGIAIPPMIGVGSSPFRGNLKPTNTDNCLNEYPSVETFSIQSAFKYDYDQSQVVKGIENIKEKQRKQPLQVEQVICTAIAEQSSESYQVQIPLLAPLINQIASYVPGRRKRKLHIGLFGYSRSVNKASLPRAITFCAALYSIGLPPELIGLDALDEKKREQCLDVYPNFITDVQDALQYYNSDCLKLLPQEVSKRVRIALEKFNVEPSQQHNKLTSQIIDDFKNNKVNSLKQDIVAAARIRGFLG